MRKGWEIKKLGEACELINRGVSPKYIDKNGLMVLNQKCIRDHKVNYELARNHDIKAKPVNEERLIKIGDVLVNSTGTGTLGRVAQVKDEIMATVDSHITIVRPTKHLFYEDFFGYAMISIEEEIEKGGEGCGGQTELSRSKLKDEYFVSYPKSIPEQKHIVSILDKAFTAIDKAKANTEMNLQNARDLFESYLQNVFANPGEDWEIKTLKEITSKIGSGATPRGGNDSYKTEGVSLIRSMNVHDFEFRERNLAFIDDQQANALNNVTLQEKDVLLNITGASVARCCVIPNKYLPARVNQHVSIIRSKKEIIDPIFLNLLLTSKYYKDQLLLTGEQGATRQAITKTQLEGFEVSFPKTLNEQQSIIRKLEILSMETKKLESIYQQKLNDLEELKKSILQKAFAGELTTAKELTL